MLSNIRMVLVNPSHPGNIGATARAMKNMGLYELYLVQPEQFPSKEAVVRASGADDILSAAIIVPTLTDALQGCSLIYGTSARTRTLEKPTVTPRQCAAAITTEAIKVAIVFGRENSGLTNEELSICHQHIVIPTDEEFSSLNLASAVQVISYELRVAYLDKNSSILSKPMRNLAAAEQVIGFYEHLESVLVAIKFLDPKQPKMLMQRLQRLFNRAYLDVTEINILRGILSRVERFIDKSAKEE